MASTVDFDVNDIASPIPGERPTGVDLRNDPDRNAQFRALREIREKARYAERRADMPPLREGDPGYGEAAEQPLPLWRKVRDGAHKLLSADSKDLDVVSYFIEALIRTDGFVGLKLGFRAVRELVDNFWDGLFPEPDEDGIETRVLPLARLNGVDGEGLIIGPIKRIPITEEKSLGPYAYWHYDQAKLLAQLKSEEDRKSRIERGAVTLEMFKQAVAESSTPFLRGVAGEIEECQREFASLCKALDAICGQDAPPSSSIHAALEDCLETLRNVARDRLAPAGESLDSGSSASEANSPESTRGMAGGPVGNREQAFRTLITVAEFFDRTEPLSLLGTQIRKVVRLGRMSPAEYYSELIEDPTVRENLFKMVGIQSPSSGESS